MPEILSKAWACMQAFYKQKADWFRIRGGWARCHGNAAVLRGTQRTDSATKGQIDNIQSQMI